MLVFSAIIGQFTAHVCVVASVLGTLFLNDASVGGKMVNVWGEFGINGVCEAGVASLVR